MDVRDPGKDADELRAGLEARGRAVRAKDVDALMAWYAPHQHSSVPLDMTTGRPILDAPASG